MRIRHTFRAAAFHNAGDHPPGIRSVLGFFHPIPGAAERRADIVADEPRIVGHQNTAAAPVKDLLAAHLLGLDLMKDIPTANLGHNFFEIQDQNDPVFHLYHAGDVVGAEGACRRFHLFPGYAVDAGDRMHQYPHGQPIELQHDHAVGDQVLVALAENVRKIDDREHAVPELHHSFNSRMAVGYLVSCRTSDDLPHLGYIDAVVTRNDIAIRVPLVYAEFHDFQFVRSTFQEYLLLVVRHRHLACGKVA